MPILLDNPSPTVESAHWHRGPDAQELAPGEVHVWRAWLDGPKPSMDTLSRSEIIRAARCASAAERRHTVTARVFLRDVLARYLHIAPEDLHLDRTPFQTAGDVRVYTSAASGTLRWTLSRSENLALLAISRAPELGLGVERVREDLPFDEMAAHFFEPEEQWGLRTVFPREHKARKFFDFWTTSEARTKAAPMHPTRSPLSLHRLTPAHGFLAAVAVGGAQDSRLALWDWR